MSSIKDCLSHSVVFELRVVLEVDQPRKRNAFGVRKPHVDRLREFFSYEVRWKIPLVSTKDGSGAVGLVNTYSA